MTASVPVYLKGPLTLLALQLYMPCAGIETLPYFPAAVLTGRA